MVMIMRNISRKHRLMNGTRVKVLQTLDFTIVVETLDTRQVHTIFRFLFRIRMRNIDDIIVRRQFPLRVAYAMTVHKCQGMTLTHMTLDVRRQPFSHGILYIACGRVKNADSLQVLVADTSYIHQNQALATNIV
jgi:ATP-dependent exoDNAse (exonuclease V) alpha subunit